MSLSFMQKVKKLRKNEKGIADIYAAIIILPFLMSLILVLLETGFYIHYRGLADTILQDTVRGISLEGGSNNIRVNTGDDWIVRGNREIASLCSTGRCKADPSYGSSTDKYGNPNYITCLGDVSKVNSGISFTCTATVIYRVISPLSKNPAFSMGLSGLFAKPISITITSIATGGA